MGFSAILINDFKYSAFNQPAKIDSSLMPKSYPIAGAPSYAVQFRSQFNQTADSYLWTFGDNTTSKEANPLHIYYSSGNYSVSLKINSSGGCQQNITNIDEVCVDIIM